MVAHSPVGSTTKESIIYHYCMHVQYIYSEEDFRLLELTVLRSSAGLPSTLDPLPAQPANVVRVSVVASPPTRRIPWYSRRHPRKCSSQNTIPTVFPEWAAHHIQHKWRFNALPNHHPTPKASPCLAQSKPLRESSRRSIINCLASSTYRLPLHVRPILRPT